MKGISVLAAFVLITSACSDQGDDSLVNTSLSLPSQAISTTTTTPSDQGLAADPQFPRVPASSKLSAVRARGRLLCGVGIRAGFAVESSTGKHSGFDVDFCRALATAVLGDPNRVEFVNAVSDRFTLIETGAVDVLFRTTTHTLGRDARVDFGPTTFYDGQRLMGRRSDFSSQSDIADLDGATVCVGGGGTTSEANIEDSTRSIGADAIIQVTSGSDSALKDFANGICDAVTADGSSLAGAKLAEPSPEAWVIFPPAPFSREPLGPAYRANDSAWAAVVNWTVWALIIADEKNITSENINTPGRLPDAEVSRLLGDTGDLQQSLGLDPDAFRRAIEQVGNYDQIFTRNLGRIGLQRAGTLNASYLDAGLIYAPPFR